LFCKKKAQNTQLYTNNHQKPDNLPKKQYKAMTDKHDIVIEIGVEEEELKANNSPQYVHKPTPPHQITHLQFSRVVVARRCTFAYFWHID
jgi:hypothetical protein